MCLTTLLAAASILLYLLALVSAAWWRRRLPAVLVRRAIRAHGGRKAIEEGAASETVEGELEAFRPLPNKAQVILQRKGPLLLVTARVGGLEQRLCSNGREGWRQVVGIVSDLSADEAARAREDQSRIHWLLKAGDPGCTLDYLEEKPLPDGARANMVRMTIRDGSYTDFYFSRETGLVMGVGYQKRSLVTAGETYWLDRELDYRLHHGVPTSFRQETYEDGELTQAFNVTRLDRSQPILDSVFQRPRMTPDEGPIVRASLDLSLGDVVIEVIVNEGPPRKFVLDTGATMTTVWKDIAKEMELPLSAPMSGVAISGSIQAHTSRARTIRIGDAIVRDVDVAVVEMPAAVQAQIAARGDFAGLIGYNFLSYFQVTLDYNAGELVLAPSSTPLPPGASAAMEIAHGVPMVDAQLEGHQLRLIVDTGSGLTALPPRLSSLLHLDQRDQARSMGLDGAPIVVRTGRVSALTVAGQTLCGASAACCPPGGLMALNLSRADGILGNDFLRHFRVTLDYARQRIVLVRSGEGE